jgi:hypothetical protein
MQRCSMVCRFEIVWKSDRPTVGLGLAQRMQLGAALGDQLVFIDWCVGCGVFGHPKILRVHLC